MKETQTEKDKQLHLPFFGIGKLIEYLRPYSGTLILMLVLGLAGSAVDIILPLFQRYAIDHFITPRVLDTLAVFILAYIATLVLQISANYVSTYRASCLELQINRDLRQRCFDHLQTLSFSYFNQNSVGYIHARVMSDTGRIGEMVSWNLMDVIWNLSYIIGAAVVMFRIHAGLALAVMIVVPLTALVIALFQKRLIGLNRRIREINSHITSDFNEGTTGAKTVKALVAEKTMMERFDRDISEMRHTSIRATHFRAMLSSLISFASFFALALVLWRGGILTEEGVIEVGTLSVFMSYALGIMDPVQFVVEVFSSLVMTQVNIERVTRLLETASDVKDTPEVIEKYGDTFHAKRENWEPLRGDITFDDVSFRYPDGDEMVLEHFNLEVKQGSNVAIVGETGAGKSTLVNLVCRFFEPTSGRLLIDGRDARERSQLWLHSNIGYVLQTPHLFSGTVRENLCYGRPDATDEEIMEALRCVCADEVVARMDHGLDSEVGEGGDLLSTGEKQLLSFARAILADPRILVLDEATSSIDTATEQTIQNAIGRVIAGRTSFVIAHRLSTVRDADVIIVVRDGKIVERGTHAELMRMRGYYFTLYTRQFEKETVERFA